MAHHYRFRIEQGDCSYRQVYGLKCGDVITAIECLDESGVVRSTTSLGSNDLLCIKNLYDIVPAWLVIGAKTPIPDHLSVVIAIVFEDGHYIWLGDPEYPEYDQLRYIAPVLNNLLQSPSKD